MTRHKSTPAAFEVSPQRARTNLIPEHASRHTLEYFEAFVMTFMTRLFTNWGDHEWRFFSIDNGGFYMAPNVNGSFEVRHSGDVEEQPVSADAAGIMATLYALSYLSTTKEDDNLSRQYEYLVDFASHHPEAKQILFAFA